MGVIVGESVSIVGLELGRMLGFDVVGDGVGDVDGFEVVGDVDGFEVVGDIDGFGVVGDDDGFEVVGDADGAALGVGVGN